MTPENPRRTQASTLVDAVRAAPTLRTKTQAVRAIIRWIGTPTPGYIAPGRRYIPFRRFPIRNKTLDLAIALTAAIAGYGITSLITGPDATWGGIIIYLAIALPIGLGLLLAAAFYDYYRREKYRNQ